MRKTYISTFHKALIKLRVVERGRAFIVIVYSQPTTHPEGITLQNISGNTDNARKDISQKKYGRSLIKPVLICQNHVENSADHFSQQKKSLGIPSQPNQNQKALHHRHQKTKNDQLTLALDPGWLRKLMSLPRA